MMLIPCVQRGTKETSQIAFNSIFAFESLSLSPVIMCLIYKVTVI